MSSIALLAPRTDHARMLYHALSGKFPIEAVVLEDPVGAWELLSRRAKRLGVWTAAGQVVFRAAIQPFLSVAAHDRRDEILRENALSVVPIPREKVTDVRSANDPEVIELLQKLQPDVVIVGGTRILKDATLAAAPDAPWVNIHAGITPLYRGVHGGYWALAQGDAAHCGVSVHLVDKGIDTGGILAQAPIVATARDNFTTYPLLQAAAGLKLLRDEVLPRLLAGDRATQPAPAGASKLWSHPTAWQYLRARARGVK